MKVTFEPRMGLKIYIDERGDFCFEQENSYVYLTIGQVRGFVKQVPDMIKIADEKRTAYLKKNEVN